MVSTQSTIVPDKMSEDELQVDINSLTWRTALWDQYEQVTNHTKRGMEFMDIFTKFIEDRASMESDYSRNIQKLCHKYQKQFETYINERQQFTHVKECLLMLKEVDGMANMHEKLAEDLSQRVAKPLKVFCRQGKTTQKQLYQAYKDHCARKDNKLVQLDRSFAEYQRSFEAMEDAYAQHLKAEANEKLSRHDQKKFKNSYLERTQNCEKCKQSYAAQRHDTNTALKEFFNTTLPDNLLTLQKLECNRINEVAKILKLMAEIQSSLTSVLVSCLDGINQASCRIKPVEDTQLVADLLCTGHSPDTERPFMELVSKASGVDTDSSARLAVDNGHTFNGHTSSPGTIRLVQKSGLAKVGTFRRLLGPKNEELKEDFSHLPPAQQKRELAETIKRLEREIMRHDSERIGLIKLLEVYRRDPKMGNPTSLEPRMKELDSRLMNLKAELSKFQGYLQQANSRKSTSNGSSSSANTSKNTSARNTANADSVSLASSGAGLDTSSLNRSRAGSDRSSSDDSSCGQSAVAPMPDVINRRADTVVHSPPSEVGDSTYADPPRVIGSATVLYDFDPQGMPEQFEHAIHIVASETVYLLGRDDDGSGWTEVRRSNLQEGFVPTNYLSQPTYFDNEYEFPEAPVPHHA